VSKKTHVTIQHSLLRALFVHTCAAIVHESLSLAAAMSEVTMQDCLNAWASHAEWTAELPYLELDCM
jgi:hypothetical protein